MAVGQYYVSQWYDSLNDYEDCNQATFVGVGATVDFKLDPGGSGFRFRERQQR